MLIVKHKYSNIICSEEIKKLPKVSKYNGFSTMFIILQN